METINKIQVRKDKAEKRIIDYLQKTSKHLFIQGKQFYKIIPFQHEDKWYFVSLEFDGINSNIKIREALTDSSYKWYGNNSLKVLKTDLFPDYNSDDRHSIKHFKAMKEKMSEVMNVIQSNFKGEVNSIETKDLNKKVGELLEGMEPIL